MRFTHLSYVCGLLIIRGKKHTVLSMDNRQEIINVLNMKEHMVFRNRRNPTGETRESPASTGTGMCPKQELIGERGGGSLLLGRLLYS